ncbi:odorant receptor 131-2-like [Pyxicephalus adspersus]|uniref:odorant receptor 131-2-like n=1 Tax=Pyxicephalus adspersus TaxID=30357 RepID=UPI003B5C1DF6
MVNLSTTHSNVTEGLIFDNTTDVIRVTILILIVLSFIVFYHWLAMILYAYFTTPHLREMARYVLFVHMLVSDTLYLLTSFFLFVSSVYLFYMPVPWCYAFGTFTTSSFRVTPYNLAIMSIERYIAICNPLRHAVTCNVRWCKSMIALMWTLGLVPIVVDFIALNFSVNRDFYSLYIVCNWLALSKNQIQSSIRSLVLIFSFSMVGLIILYTYIKVMLVAQKINSGKSSASKAGKTVLLHAFQLFLCMTSFFTALTDIYLRNEYAFLPSLNFFFFMCVPRFISPLIYGIRDNVFRKYTQNFYTHICLKGLFTK